MLWEIPITIIEYGRSAVVEAETKTEALRKVRERAWVECSDADYYKITKVGRCEPRDR